MYAYNVLLTNTCNMYEIKILLLLLLLLKSYRDTKRILHSSLRNAEIKCFGDQLQLNSNHIFKTWKVLKTILALNNT